MELKPLASEYLLFAPDSWLLRHYLKHDAYYIKNKNIYFLVKKAAFPSELPLRFATNALIILEKIMQVDLVGSVQVVGEIDGLTNRLVPMHQIPPALKPLTINLDLIEDLQPFFNNEKNKTLKNQLERLPLEANLKADVEWYWRPLLQFNEPNLKLEINDPILKQLVYESAALILQKPHHTKNLITFISTLDLEMLADVFIDVLQMVNINRVLYLLVQRPHQINIYQEARQIRTNENNVLYCYWSQTLNILEQHFDLEHPQSKINFPARNKKNYDEFLNICDQKTTKRHWDEDNWKIAFENVILDFSDYEFNLEPKIIKAQEQNRFRIFSQIPHHFFAFNEMNAEHQKAKQRVDDYLNSLFLGPHNEPDHQAIAAFWEAVGFSAFDNAKLRKMFIFTGKGRNGKSTLFRFIKQILGKDNYTELSYQQINEKFHLARLRNKKANFTDELPSYLDWDSGIIKSVIAGDPITVEEKFEKPTDLTNTATIFIATNHAVKFKTYSIALKDRIYFFELKGRFDEGHQGGDRKNIIPKVFENPDATLTYIFDQMIAGIKRVLKNKFAISRSNANDALILELQRDNNKLLDFLIEEKYYNYADDQQITYTNKFDEAIKELPIEQLFQNYRNWSENAWNSATSVIWRTFIKEIQDIFPLKTIRKINPRADQVDQQEMLYFFEVDEVAFQAFYRSDYQSWKTKQTIQNAGATNEN